MVEDHVYESAVRGRAEFRRAFMELRAKGGEERTLTAMRARADLRYVLMCLSEVMDAEGVNLDPEDTALLTQIRADLAQYDHESDCPSGEQQP